jgi:alpha-galactosidase
MKNRYPAKIVAVPARLFVRCIAALLLAMAGAPSARATNYYVSTNGNDGNDGMSSSTAWATVNRGDTSGVLLPGDVVNVQAGTYRPAAAGIILQTRYGTPASPITFLANGPVVIDQTGVGGTSYGFQVWAKNIVLSGFEVKGAAHGISLSGTGSNQGHGSVVTNCVIHDSALVDSSGVQLLSVSNVTVVGNVIYNINGSANSPWSPVGAGIRASACDNVSVFNNTIDNCYLGIFYYGAAFGAGPYGRLVSYNNIIVNSRGWAFVNPWSTDGSLIKSGYNLVYSNAIDFGNYPAGNNGPYASDVSGQNPLFVFPARHDYHLLTNSPALDRGTNVGRAYLGAAPDLGAFEGANPPAAVGTLSGRVTANVAGNPGVPGATVQTLDGGLSTQTDPDGYYQLTLTGGSVTVKATGRSLSTQTQDVNVPAGGAATLNFSLSLTNSARTFYVDNAAGNDSNPGTIAQPWKTIPNGDAKNLLHPGDTILINAGSYAQASSSGILITNDSGYPFAPITYKAQGSVLIDQNIFTGTSYGFRVGVPGVALSGFEIRNAQHGIYLAPGSDFCTVDSCVLHDGKAAGQDAEGIYVDQSAGVTLTRNILYNITDPGNGPWSPVGCGIRAGEADNLRVWNNTIDNCYLGLFVHGTIAGLPFHGHITAQNNIVANCAGWGFVNPWTTDPTLCASGYNLVFGNGIAYGNFPPGNNGPLSSDVALDPQFVNRAAHNYQLQAGSPALNTGLEVGLPFVGIAPDLGALESTTVVPPKTYHVDAVAGNDNNPGTTAQPWKTIQNGDSKGLLNAGDTVVVNAGTYPPLNSNGVYLNKKRGTPAVPITYSAMPGTIIDQGAFSGTSYGIRVASIGISLSGFEIKNAQHGIYISPGCDSCTIDRCVIHDGQAGGQDAEGIYVNQAANVTLTRNVIYNITDGADTPWSPVGCGIRAADADSLNIWNNTIDHCYLGIYYYGANPGGGPYGHLTAQNNIVVNCGGWGFVNPWSTDPTIFTSGYNLVLGNAIDFGNFPAGNNAPLSTDISGLDPQFANAAAHDYRLLGDSPAIEQGTDVGLAYPGSNPSIGAFETPFVVNQPPVQTATNGFAVTFNADVLGTPPYTIQWMQDGVTIPGATGANYTLPAASFCDSGTVFSAVVSNSLGTVTNNGTLLTVTAPATSLHIQRAMNQTLLSISSQTRQWYNIDASTNLTDWVRVAKTTATENGLSVPDPAPGMRQRFYRTRLTPPEPSFSFTFNGSSSTQFLGGWYSNRVDSVLDSNRTQSVTVYTDPASGLQVTCQATEYLDFPALEWVLYFKNTGVVDTPIIENVNAIDLNLARGSCGEFNLHYNDGCSAVVTDFQPHQTNLSANARLSFAPFGGRSSGETAFPYYNIAEPEGSGDIVAIGWSGEWAASFARDGATNLNVKAGMQLTHLVLHPGEQIRTPAILTLRYEGGWLKGQNSFRKLIQEHYTPTPNGQRIVDPVAASPHGYVGLNDTSESNMVMTITNLAYNNFPVDTYWIDAGWFYSDSIWEFGTGNWYPDPVRYPHGMKPVADAAHAHGMKFLLWFEPERVMPGTLLYNNHPDWLLSGDTVIGGRPCYLLNLGNPTALNWAVTNFSGMISNIGIDIYRLDCNMPPLNYWRGNDATNRQGITEIRYIMGLYSFLDGLRTNKPSLIIDNSSAAGHRLDFEMARRCIPINRSDYGAPIGEQGMEYGLSLWLPYQGVGSYLADPYTFRSGMGETAVYFFPGFGNPNDPSWAPGRDMVNFYKSIRPYYLGDFYPLTPYSVSTSDWMAYQFDRPDLGGGVVHAFRRDDGRHSMALSLMALDPAASYAVINPDAGSTNYLSGAELMNNGLKISIDARPGAALFLYQKVP